MASTQFKSTLALLALAVATLVIPGCAGERAPIDRTQPGILPKSFFVGANYTDPSDDPEFYMRTTVVDVSAGAGSESLFTNSDAQPTVRIRWEMTEKAVIARLAYELVNDSDYRGVSRKVNDGQVVAAFPIEKHLDVVREYNAETGEENNVVVENDIDRPWYSRDYVRVDWSENKITSAYDLDALSLIGMYDGVQWESLKYTASEKDEEDHLVFEKEAGYLDMTVKVQAKPKMIHDPDWGDFPACYLIGAFPEISCNPSEVKLRMAFRKVVDTDYEALEYDGNKMEAFGLFTNDRYGYDRKFGIVDDKWHHFASRWNIWEKSHAEVTCAVKTPVGASPHRDDNADGTEDECAAAGKGSRCDEFKQKCTLPLKDRAVKTIPWYVNKGFPESLFAGSRKVVSAWNESMRVAVAAGRIAECRRTGGTGCEAKFGWTETWADDLTIPAAAVPNVFVLCHNPSDPAKDDKACGSGVAPRIGDLRYNLFSIIDSPQAQRPWGIMMDAEDPLTGEKIAGSVNQWGSTLDQAAGRVAEIIELLNGGISPENFIEGLDVSEWLATNRAPAGKPMSAAELASRKAAFDAHAMDHLRTSTGGKPKKGPKRLQFKQRMDALAQAGKSSPGNATIAARMKKLRGTDIESKLLVPEILQIAGVSPSATPTQSDVDRASPVVRTNPAYRRNSERVRSLGRVKRHSCVREAPDADHLVGLARQLQNILPQPDRNKPLEEQNYRSKLYDLVRERFSIGVFAHEFGHSVGLRHNFAGSFDSLNYADEYWQLRTRNGTVTKPCVAGNTDGASCIGPRYLDPITEEEVNGQIGSYATTSVMDYPGDATQDMMLPGKYDRAAIRFAYGGTVDVWNAPGLSVTGSGEGKRHAYQLLGFDDPPGLFGIIYMPAPNGDTTYLHYSQYASEFGLLSNCTPNDKSPLGTSCKAAPMDVVDYRDMKPIVTDKNYPSLTTVGSAVDANGRVRRGYMFSSDEYAGSGNVPSFAYDAGADAYEQMKFLEANYENRYIVDNFRRNRTLFNSYDTVARTQYRTLDTMQLIAKTFGFAMVLENDDPTNPDPALLADGNYGPLAVGSTLAFDLFTKNLVRPEPGVFCSTEADDCPNYPPVGVKGPLYVADAFPAPDTTHDFKIPVGPGRFVHNDFDYSKGYWWSDYQKQVGSFYDKVWSIYYLAEGFDSFISNSKEDFVDGRYKNINFATLYPTQMRRLMANLMTGDAVSFAPWATTGSGTVPTAQLSYPSWRDVAGPAARPANPKIVDPLFGWNEQLFAMVWGTMLFPTSWSQDFINDARIVVSDAEQVNWPAAETYTFVDPLTSLTYRAHTIGTEQVFGVAHEKSIGARMLEWANELIYSAYVVEKDVGTGAYILNPNGTPKLKLTAGKPTLNPDFPGADAVLKKYVTNLEVMRQLTRMYEPITAGPDLP
ncbi:MAG: hypothetical protein U0174_04295 [Polyangiaceae bacterium]